MTETPELANADSGAFSLNIPFSGMLWLGQLLYPEYADYDLQTEITEYCKLFYGCELSQPLYDNLLADALP
jgi:iron complex transport system substrate-binding protein